MCRRMCRHGCCATSVPAVRSRCAEFRPRGVQMIAAVAIDTPKGRILDEGPQARDDGEAFEKAKRGPMSAQGIVKRPIHGPKGETRGAVLEDGRIVRLPPHEAERFSDLLVQRRKDFRSRRRRNDLVRNGCRSPRDRRLSRHDEARRPEETEAWP